MTYALAGFVVLGIVLPHAIDLRRAVPAIAIALWVSSLALRALTACFAVLYLTLYLPRSDVFSAITHWCWHTVLPLMATHLGLDGHRVGTAAMILPPFVLAASALSAAFAVTRAARSLRRLLNRHAIGVGPRDSLIIGGPEVLVAAAGIVRPRLVVSAGALTTLDDDELAAGLDHERGHIRHFHRFVLVFCQICKALGGLLPGTRRAAVELEFHLERDADRFATRHNDRLALASAICKATTNGPESVAVLSLRGYGVTERVRQLLEEQPSRPRSAGVAALSAAALTMLALTLALAALLPATALAEAHHFQAAVRHCAT